MNTRSSENLVDADPITAEIIIHDIHAVPNLTDKNITGTAFNPLVAEFKDYSVGMVDADGNLVSKLRGSLKIYGESRPQQEDLVITYNAETLGQYINNVMMCTPTGDRYQRHYSSEVILSCDEFVLDEVKANAKAA